MINKLFKKLKFKDKFNKINNVFFFSHEKEVRTEFKHIHTYKYIFNRFQVLEKVNSKETFQILDTPITDFSSVKLTDVCESSIEATNLITALSAEKHDILLGKFKLLNNLLKCDFHFINNRLFMFRYNFPYLNRYQRDKILSLYKKKYLERKYYDEPVSELVIHCPNDALFNIDISYNITVTYVMLDSFYQYIDYMAQAEIPYNFSNIDDEMSKEAMGYI